jgi:hypothetical protein
MRLECNEFTVPYWRNAGGIVFIELTDPGAGVGNGAAPEANIQITG